MAKKISKSKTRITSRKKKRAKKNRSALKTIKFNKTNRKMRAYAKKALKAAAKNLTIKKKTFRKIDAEVAENIKPIVENAVIKVVNDLIGTQKKEEKTEKAE